MYGIFAESWLDPSARTLRSRLLASQLNVVYRSWYRSVCLCLVEWSVSGESLGRGRKGEDDCLRKTHSCAKTLTPTLSPREREPAELVIFG